MLVVTADGSGECKSQEQAEETKEGTLNCGTMERFFEALMDPPTQLEHEKHHGEENKGSKRIDIHQNRTKLTHTTPTRR